MKQMKLQMLVLGLLLVAAGVALALFNVGTLPLEYKPIVFSWPSLLLALGFTFLFGDVRKIFVGLILMVAGGFFLLSKLDVEWFNRAMIWPVVIITFGLVIIFKSFLLRRWHSRCCDPEKMKEWKEKKVHHFRGVHCDIKNESRSFSDFFERSCVFGGTREKVESQNFSGGEVNCIFGNVVLDFTHAQLAEGVNYLEVNAVFGGVELYIPNDWSVEIRQTCVFGGFVDRRTKSSFDVADGRKLILVLTSVFGGGEIKSHA